jgi:signal transduction histidine kinase
VTHGAAGRGFGAHPPDESEPGSVDVTPDQPAGSRESDREAAPSVVGPPASEVTFPQLARLELDDLLEQLVERAQDVLNTQGRLRGLLAATRAISSDLSLPVLLQRITQSACDLVGARYGALGVIGPDQELTEFVTVGLDPETIAAIGHLPRGKGILGLLISDPRPLRLVKLDKHPKSVGVPAHHPPMHSFVGVPIRVGDQVFGNLYLTEKTPTGPFTAEDEELLTALASAAGVAIDNARLYEVERRRQRWLTAAAEISRELLAGENDPLPLITGRARQVADADLAVLLLPAEDAPEMLMVAAADGLGAATVLGRVVPREKSPARRAVTESLDLLPQDARAASAEFLTPQTPDGPALLVHVPEASDGQPGVLFLVRNHGARTFDGDEQEMIASFADQAGVALKLANAQAARRRLLLLEDRDRIARDLHDHVIQRLFAAGLGLTGLASRTTEPETQRRLGEYTDQLDDTIQAIRQTIFALQRHRETGVQARVLDIVRAAVPVLGFTPNLRFEGPLDALVDEEASEHVTAIVREALTNTARHAKASSMTASLSVTDGRRLVVSIGDDGVGIGKPTRTSGLANMRSRAEQLGGTFTLTSPTAPEGGGTLLEWVIPLGME